MSLSFEWNEKKSEVNRKKHGVLFEEAATVFNDPLSITIPDSFHSLSEHRFIILGESINRRLLVVVHVDRGNRVRIITAREATKVERKQYEEKN